MNPVYKAIANYFWTRCDSIDAMPENTIDELANKADVAAKLRKAFNHLPKHAREAIQNERRAAWN